MYWTQWSGANPNLGKINRISMDGTSNTVIFNNETVERPSALSLDYATETLYFVDSSRTFVAKSATNGTNVQVILSTFSENFTSFFAKSMDVLEGQPYITETSRNGVYTVVENESAMEGNIELAIIEMLKNTPGGIRVVNVSQQPLNSSKCEL